MADVDAESDLRWPFFKVKLNYVRYYYFSWLIFHGRFLIQDMLHSRLHAQESEIKGKPYILKTYTLYCWLKTPLVAKIREILNFDLIEIEKYV